MKKMILPAVAVALLICLAAGKPDRPEANAVKFLTAMCGQQFDVAAELSTPKMIDQIAQLTKNLGSYYTQASLPQTGTGTPAPSMKDSSATAINHLIRILTCAIHDSTAAIHYSIGDDTTTRLLRMVSAKGKWLVSSVQFDFIGSPRANALTFLNGLYQMDYRAARQVSTEETRKQLAMYEEIMGLLGDSVKSEARNLSVDIRSERIAGDKATLEYMVSSDLSPKSVRLVYQEGKWQVVWTKMDIVSADESDVRNADSIPATR